MRVQVAGRQMDVGESLRSRIEADLAASVSKYFSRATDAVVTVAKNGVGCEVDCAVHLASGISLQSQGHAADAYAAFDDALAKLEKRVRRYKRRLKNHHAEHRAPLPAEGASAYVLAPFGDDHEADLEPAEASPANGHADGHGEAAPLVIAESKASVLTMTVSTAVMQLDLSVHPALLFRNAAHGGLNVVYRRADGNIGWIDPGRPK